MSTTLASAAPPQRTPAAWEDCLDVFYDPAAVFDRRRDGRFALALLVLTVGMTFFFFLSQHTLSAVFDAQFARAMEAQGTSGWGRERMEWMRTLADRVGVLSFGVGLPLGVLLLAACTLGAARVADIPLAPGGALVAAVFSQYPRLLEQAANVVQGMVLPPERLASFYSVSFSLARVLEPLGVHPLALAFAARVDLFTLWSTALMVVALRRLAGATAAQAWYAAGLLWLLGVVPVLMRA
ncbi:MAG: YIP1 family protein [Gemmatimonadetes bacterium]|nr:YIP1 family protein [Gemmatimonadota bacterium]